MARASVWDLVMGSGSHIINNILKLSQRISSADLFIEKCSLVSCQHRLPVMCEHTRHGEPLTPNAARTHRSRYGATHRPRQNPQVRDRSVCSPHLKYMWHVLKHKVRQQRSQTVQLPQGPTSFPKLSELVPSVPVPASLECVAVSGV